MAGNCAELLAGKYRRIHPAFFHQLAEHDWTTINIVEAVVGAVLLRKLLPWYNPLQNLADWLRLAFGSAIVPPLLGVFWLSC